MAKLIKRDQRSPSSDAPEGAPQDGLGAAHEGDDANPQRSGIIDRPSYEARAEAVGIRDRAKAQAEEILAEARSQAETLLADAQTEAEQRRTSAHEAGRKSGHEEGLSKLTEAALRVGQSAEQIREELAPQIVSLSMAIARRILGRELEFEPETIVQIVKQALSDKARQRREITLRINPADAQMIKENRAQLVEMLSRSKEIAIQEDPEVAPHGVIIETEAGIIDAQLDVQLAAMERALQAVGNES